METPEVVVLAGLLVVLVTLDQLVPQVVDWVIHFLAVREETVATLEILAMADAEVVRDLLAGKMSIFNCQPIVEVKTHLWDLGGVVARLPVLVEMGFVLLITLPLAAEVAVELEQLTLVVLHHQQKTRQLTMGEVLELLVIQGVEPVVMVQEI